MLDKMFLKGIQNIFHQLTNKTTTPLTLQKYGYTGYAQ